METKKGRIEHLKDLPDRLLKLVEENEWQFEFTTVNGDLVQKLNSGGKENHQPYMITGIINASAEQIAKLLHDDVKDLSKWNHGIILSKQLELIDKDTDINYQLTKGVPGIISKRDFVVLRHRREINTPILINELNCKSFVLALESLKYPECPKVPGIVRGKHILGGWILDGEDKEKTHFKWILNLDLKMSGLIPNFIVQQTLLQHMVKTLDELRLVLQN